MEEALIAPTVARLLLESGAVSVAAGKPFILRSGWASPVYVDVRSLISSVAGRRQVIDAALSVVRNRLGGAGIDAIAGAETSGVPWAAWLADSLDLPLLILRKKSLGFGRDAQIEGTAEPGARVLLVDDLTTDGQSKRKFCQAVRAAGLTLEHALTIFYYDTFAESREAMRDMNITLHALATWHDVIALAEAGHYLTAADLRTVEEFLLHTPEWSRTHGGIGRLP